MAVTSYGMLRLRVTWVCDGHVLFVADDTAQEEKDESLSLSSSDEATLEQLLEGEEARERERESMVVKSTLQQTPCTLSVSMETETHLRLLSIAKPVTAPWLP